MVSNVFPNSVVTIEKASSPGGPWTPEKNAFTIDSVAQLYLSPTGSPSFYRALAADLTGLTAPWTLLVDDVVDLLALALRLSSPSGADGVAIYLSDQLSPETVNLLFAYSGGPDPDLQQRLVDELNGILQNGPIYDSQNFSRVHLSPSTQRLLAQSPQGTELVELNRLLLDDAFPVELRPKRNLGYTNLVNSYGLLTTIAGSGNILCTSCNSWDPSYEEGQATNAALSSPHISMADRAGNVYIADKRAHAIRKVTPDGTIVTVAGNNLLGFGDTNPVPATSVSLNNPNGLWVREDGAFYILDRDNGLIRRVGTNGIMTMVVDNERPIPGGRGLWVNQDESQIIYSAGSELKSWDSTNGLTVIASGFLQLANIAVDPQGNMVVTDSDANLVYRINQDGSKTVIAGNGSAMGGGDGQFAVDTALLQVRGIWFLPSGAYFLTTDSGGQVWYVDTEAHVHLFLNGNFNDPHRGDGAWVYDSPTTAKMGFVRGITTDYDGNLLITEGNAGYVRKVQFLRLQP